jgi:hypothetical protein
VTSNVKEGTLLLVSKALAVSSTDRESSMPLVHDESRHLILSKGECRLITEVIRTIRMNPQRTSELYQLYAGDYPPVILPNGIVDPGRINEIVSLNSFGAQNDFDVGVDVENDNKSVFSGLWILPSFINHRCSENAIRLFYGDLMMLRALRDLREGEEILINYVGDRLDKIERLKEKWKIHCDCELCQEEKATPQQQKDLRMRFFKRAKQLRSGSIGSEELKLLVRNMEATYKPKDRFRPLIIVPIFGLFMAYLKEGNIEEALVEGQRMLNTLPRLDIGLEIQIRLRMAGIKLADKRVKDAKQSLKEMKIWLWNRTGLELTDLKIAAKDLIEIEDHQWNITRYFSTLDDEDLS